MSSLELSFDKRDLKQSFSLYGNKLVYSNYALNNSKLCYVYFICNAGAWKALTTVLTM